MARVLRDRYSRMVAVHAASYSAKPQVSRFIFQQRHDMIVLQSRFQGDVSKEFAIVTNYTGPAGQPEIAISVLQYIARNVMRPEQGNGILHHFKSRISFS